MLNCCRADLIAKLLFFSAVFCSYCIFVPGLAAARNLAFHAPYTYFPPPQYALTQDNSDSTKLTDGHYASGHFWTSRKETVGWQQSGTIRIEIDLLASYAVDAICLDTARGERSGVSFPKRVDMFVSVDKEHYRHLGDLLQGNDHADGPYLVKKFCSPKFAAAGRYVVLFVQPESEYTFVDEIEVLGSGDKSTPNTVYPLKKENLASFQQNLDYSSHYSHALQSITDDLVEKLNGLIKKYPELSDIMVKLRKMKPRFDDLAVYSNPDKLQSTQSELYTLLQRVAAARFQDALIVWSKDPWAVFTPFDSPAPEQQIRDAVRFDLLRDGTASDAVALTNNSSCERTYKISVRTAKVRGPFPSVELREARPVLTAKGGLRTDPLVALDNNEVSLLPGESKQIWLSVRAGDCGAGRYNAQLIVSDAEGKQSPVKVPLSMEIWPVDMPQKQHLMADNWAYLNWRPIKNIPGQAVADLFAHHINVVVMPPEQLPWPNVKSVASRVPASYAAFDQYLLYHKGARMFLFYMNYNNADQRSFGGKHEFMSAGWKSVFKTWITDWVMHLRKQGLTYNDFAFYPVDEPQNSKEAGYLVNTAKEIKEIDPALQVFTTLDSLKRLDMFDMARIAHTVDIFQVSVNSLSSLNASVLKNIGKPVWLYGGGDKTAGPMDFFRLQAWRAFRDGFAGIGFWAYADTGQCGTAWNDLDGARPDYSVIYEGENSIISSKRWEAWRHGVEDYELLLQARGKLKPGLETEEFNRRVDKVIDQPGDHGYFEETRRSLFNIASRP